MWFIGIEVEQERNATPPKKNPGSAPAIPPKIKVDHSIQLCSSTS